MPDLPKNGLSLLYALFHAPDHKITSSVKFNKIIAKLYTEGLKKDVQLSLLPMGSAVQDRSGSQVMGIRDFADQWQSQGFITITNTSTKLRDREDYQLTKKGIDFFERLGDRSIEETGLLSHEKAKKIIAEIQALNSFEASKRGHIAFFFDESTEVLHSKFNELSNSLQRKYNIFAGYPPESSEFDIAGMIGFMRGICRKILADFYSNNQDLTPRGEQYLAHFYFLKHLTDFLHLLNQTSLNINSIELKYFLARHVALESEIIHSPDSEEFEAAYFFDRGDLTLQQTTQ